MTSEKRYEKKEIIIKQTIGIMRKKGKRTLVEAG
jgi:hypothetical protein